MNDIEPQAYLADVLVRLVNLWPNNPLERILREIRRRTRVVGAFPDGQSALNLAAARLRPLSQTGPIATTLIYHWCHLINLIKLNGRTAAYDDVALPLTTMMPVGPPQVV